MRFADGSSLISTTINGDASGGEPSGERRAIKQLSGSASTRLQSTSFRKDAAPLPVTVSGYWRPFRPIVRVRQ